MNTFKFNLGIILAIVTLCGIGYVLIWWGIIIPITTIATAIDLGTVTATLVGGQVIHFFLRGILAAFIGWVGFTLSTLCFATGN